MTRLLAGIAGFLVAALVGCSSSPAPSPSAATTAVAGTPSGGPASASPAASSPVPSVPAAAAGWRVIPTAATLGQAHLLDLARFRGSLVAVGDGAGNGGESIGQIWASPDGMSWSSIAGSLALKGTVLRSIAVSDAGIVVVGWSETDAVVLYSPDGLHWSQPSLPGSHPGSSAMSVAAHDGRFVAVGGGGEPNAAVSWASGDGRTWQRISIVDEANQESLASVVAGPGGFVVSGGHGSHGAIWTSSDGSAWSRIDLPASDTNDEGRLRFVDGTFVLMGSGGVVWVSPDGRHWTRSTIPGFGVGLFDIAATPSGLVAVGRSDTEPGEPGVVAVAAGNLSSWTTAPPDPVFVDGLASSLLMAPDGRTLVGVGTNGAGESVFVLPDLGSLLSGDSGISLAIGNLHTTTTGDGTIVSQIRMRVSLTSARDVQIATGGKSAWPRFSVRQAGNHALTDVDGVGGPSVLAARSTTDYDLTFDIPAEAEASPARVVFASTYQQPTVGAWVLGMLLIEADGHEVDVRLPFEVRATP